MCRPKIKKIRAYRQVNLLFIIILGVSGLCVFGVNAGFLGDFLSETSAKLSDDDYIHSIGGKSIITDLYYKSLDIARTNEVSAINNSIKRSVDYMKDKYPNCNIKKTDILNILYNSNDSFRRSFKQSISNNYKNKPQYPSEQDYLNSCHTFMGCFYGTSTYYDSPSILKNCSLRSNDLYSKMYINSNSITSFDQINFADDLFWNGNLDDADYDILYDIDIIGKILFQSSKTAPEVLYYQFPDVNFGGDIDPVIPYDGTIDWFSPYDPGDFPSSGSGSTSSNNSGIGINSGSINGTNTSLGGQSDDTLQDLSLDEEVQNFLESNGESVFSQNGGNDTSVLNGNICITGSYIQGESGFNNSSGEIIKQYLSGLIKEINESKKQSNGSLTTGGGSLISGNIVNLTGGKQEIINQIDDQVEMLSSIDDQSSQQAIQGCINKCDGLPIDDKAICIIKCTCTEFSSPEYNDVLKAGAFKIKFCMIPVQNKGFSKNGKTVYSIEEIYEEVYNILTSLRDSGELLVSRKTKEFLESSTTKNKFGKIFSFSISSSFKSIFGETDSSVSKREEESFLKNIVSSILGHSDNKQLDAQKYLLIQDPLYEINKNEIVKSSAFGQNKGLDEIVDPTKLLQEDRLIKFNSLVENFLFIHLKFWESVEEMMKDINQTAEALSKK